MGIIIITIHIFWAFIGMMVAIGTIATIDCQSKFYWRHMSKKQQFLMAFLCGPIIWIMFLAGLILNR